MDAGTQHFTVVLAILCRADPPIRSMFRHLALALLRDFLCAREASGMYLAALLQGPVGFTAKTYL